MPPLPVPVDVREDLLFRYPLPECFTWAVEEYGFATPLDAALHTLFYPLRLPVPDGENMQAMVDWLPGGPFESDSARGPIKQHKIMLIGKMPNESETQVQRLFSGAGGTVLHEVAAEVGISDLADWYCTNLVRFLPPDGGKTLKSGHLAHCSFLLAQELAMVRPRYLLLLGADVVKFVCGRKATLEKVRSQTFIFQLDTLGQYPLTPEEHPDKLAAEYCSSLMVSTMHPNAVVKEAGYRHGFKRDLELFKILTENGPEGPKPGEGCDYRIVKTAAELKVTVDEVLASTHRELAIDCEWGGTDYMSGWLRTIQFSWKDHTACLIALRGPKGEEYSTPVERTEIFKQLNRLTTAEGMQIDGHALRADAKWLEHQGVKVMDNLGFDTMLADHVLNENAEHGLESCAVRYTDMGRYDYPLVKWCQANGLTPKVVREHGYATIPDDVLFLYAQCDADATWRCKQELVKRLKERGLERVHALFQHVVMGCTYPILEIEMAGILVDKDRMEDLVRCFDEKKDELLLKVRQEIENPAFNPRSTKQMQKLLFGPAEAGGLELMPYKTTGKPSQMWEDLDDFGRLRHSPSTDIETLESLAGEHPVASMIRDFKFIDQVAKSFLRLPEEDDRGNLVYMSGLVGAIDYDGRIRTSINQMSETGRWKSSNPNLQNLPKKQDKQLERIMGKGVPKIRSCFIAETGKVLIEADYKSAEIYTLGYLANCKKLIQDADGDLHARGAVTRMGCEKWPGFDQFIPPPDWWLELYKALRVASKTVSFGGKQAVA